MIDILLLFLAIFTITALIVVPIVLLLLKMGKTTTTFVEKKFEKQIKQYSHKNYLKELRKQYLFHHNYRWSLDSRIDHCHWVHAVTVLPDLVLISNCGCLPIQP